MEYDNPDDCIYRIEQEFDPSEVPQSFVDTYRVIHRRVGGIKHFTDSRVSALGYIAATLSNLRIKSTSKPEDRRVTQKDMAVIFDKRVENVNHALKTIMRKNLFIIRL